MPAWWTAAAIAALAAGDEAAAIEFGEQPDLHGLATIVVDSWALLVRSTPLESSAPNQRYLLTATIALVTRWPINDRLAISAINLIDSYRLPARVAWELAGAGLAKADRVITPDQPLMIAATMLGYRTYSTGEPN